MTKLIASFMALWLIAALAGCNGNIESPKRFIGMPPNAENAQLLGMYWYFELTTPDGVHRKFLRSGSVNGGADVLLELK